MAVQHELGVCWASHYGGMGKELWNSSFLKFSYHLHISFCMHLDLYTLLVSRHLFKTYLFISHPDCSLPYLLSSHSLSYIRIHWVPHHAATHPSIFTQKRAGLPCAVTKHGRHLLLYSTWARLSSIRNRFPRAKVQGTTLLPLPEITQIDATTQLSHIRRGFRSVPFRIPGCWFCEFP